MVNGAAPLLRRARAALLAAALGCATVPRGPAAVAEADAGGAVLRYEGAADDVYVCGTMTGWEPVPLAREARGFALTLPLPAGRYEYRLEVHRGAEVQVVVPEGAERTDDGFGGENAILRVP